MDKSNIQQTFIEKQCISAAMKLIQTTINIKSQFGGDQHKDLLSNPKINLLIKDLDTWTEFLLAKEGSL